MLKIEGLPVERWHRSRFKTVPPAENPGHHNPSPKLPPTLPPIDVVVLAVRGTSCALAFKAIGSLAEHLWASVINSKELDVTGPRRLALQGWIVIGLLVLIVLGIVGLGAEIKDLPYLWQIPASEIK
jgi:hypothetical protein